jgi:hypothetical protein
MKHVFMQFCSVPLYLPLIQTQISYSALLSRKPQQNILPIMQQTKRYNNKKEKYRVGFFYSLFFKRNKEHFGSSGGRHSVA